MRTEIIILILGMTLVTYIPRALPSVLMERIRLSPKLEKFLNLIPYTAMSALIFPGIFSVDEANPLIGIVGGATAVLLAWRKLPLIVCVLAAIVADMLLYLFLFR